MTLKEIAKNSSVLYWINAKIKCYELKRDLNRLVQDYKKKAVACGFTYEPEEAKREFKRRHRLYRSDFVPREVGTLRVFWVGNNQNQDESGFIQSLQRACGVTVFYNVEGKYGLLKIDPSVQDT